MSLPSESPKWGSVVVVVLALMLCLWVIKTTFLDATPIMRFIIPEGFRGRIRISRSSKGIGLSASRNVVTFNIPASGDLTVTGELPYEQWSRTEAFWTDGQAIGLGVNLEKRSVGDDRIYFWDAYSDRSNVWCFVGTQREYHEWLRHWPE